jgi:ABC-type transport system involved in cytochrome bd biosynthesis fused ATPase/permease subunit
MLAGRGARFIGMLSLAIMAIMTGVSRWVISTRMSALRAAMQTPMDLIARDDARRVAFDSLHQYSVRVMGVAMVAGLIAFLLICAQSARRN